MIVRDNQRIRLLSSACLVFINLPHVSSSSTSSAPRVRSSRRCANCTKNNLQHTFFRVLKRDSAQSASISSTEDSLCTLDGINDDHLCAVIEKELTLHGDAAPQKSANYRRAMELQDAKRRLRSVHRQDSVGGTSSQSSSSSSTQKHLGMNFLLNAINCICLPFVDLRIIG